MALKGFKEAGWQWVWLVWLSVEVGVDWRGVVSVLVRVSGAGL